MKYFKGKEDMVVGLRFKSPFSGEEAEITEDSIFYDNYISQVINKSRRNPSDSMFWMNEGKYAEITFDPRDQQPVQTINNYNYEIY